MPESPSSPRARILVVDDEASLRRIAQYRLAEAGYEVVLAQNGSEALAALAASPIDLVVTDLKMPGLPGEELVREVLRREPGLPVIVVTGHGTVEGAVDAMKQGVADYVLKPVSWDEMLVTVQRVLEAAALVRDNQRLRSELVERTRFEGIVGSSGPMRALFGAMERLRNVDTTVLVVGESGTGKELVARALHFQGARAKGPFVAVNCGAIPEGLVESQLFGHERGAFTGADRLHRGHFEQAQGGTLFLDEVGEIPPAAQVKLLRALTERRITRVGGETPIAVDVRVIAASNRDLEAAVEDGDFRKDLYYRLAVVPLSMPPLRERRDDVLPLAESFAQRFGGAGTTIAPSAAAALRAYDWPGNVRELENAMERAVVLGGDDHRIEAADLPPALREPAAPPPLTDDFPSGGVDLAAIERGWIRKALLHTGGNRTRAAKLLAISRQTLLYRMEKHGIDIPPPGGVAEETRA
jgi:two-component system, NtrC family, response regulator